MSKEDYIIDVSDATVRFNMAPQKVANFKGFIIQFLVKY